MLVLEMPDKMALTLFSYTFQSFTTDNRYSEAKPTANKLTEKLKPLNCKWQVVISTGYTVQNRAGHIYSHH